MMAEEEAAELLPSRQAGATPASWQGRSISMPASGFMPSISAPMLQSRVDHEALIEFMEGGGRAESAAVEPTPGRKKVHDVPMLFGMDQRPFFPAVLITSLVWSMLMTRTQGEVVERVFGPSIHWNAMFLLLYATTIFTMVFVSLCDPGLMSEELFKRTQAEEVPEKHYPQRAFKHWLYRRPVLRFHQYCRWVTNSIGLRNHREYMVMLAGFATIGTLDTIVDALHLILRLGALFTESFFENLVTDIMIVLHLAYSAYFAWYCIPLLRMHVGFVCRNELTKEWQNDLYQVVVIDGETVSANDLDPETYNWYFDKDAFQYDSKINPWDKADWKLNCWTFWCTPRYTPGQLGEF
jgi:hypothetical protein